MLPSDLQLMLKPDCKASVDVITEKYSGVSSAFNLNYTSDTFIVVNDTVGWFLPHCCPPYKAQGLPHSVQVNENPPNLNSVICDGL